MYLGYAYGGAGDGEWGNWATRLHEVTLALSDAPSLDDTAVANAEQEVTHRDRKLMPEVLTVKAEHQSYTLEKDSQPLWVMAFDGENDVFPVLSGATFSDYDTSVVKIFGGRVWPVGPGTTRVTLRWRGFTGDFVVHVTE